jgi:hypothetical protein
MFENVTNGKQHSEYIFCEYLDDFVVCYINHIFIFLKTWKTMNDMYVLFWTNLKKSNSTPNWKNVNFIKPKWNSLVTSSLEIIHMDLHKLQTIMNWVTPTFFCDVQCFHGFANFYLHFIVHYFTIVVILNHLIWKDQPFAWDLKLNSPCILWRFCFMITPLLIYEDLF